MTAMSMILGASGAGGFGVTVSPYRIESGGTADTVTTGLVSAIVSGGSGSYTYLWEVVASPPLGSVVILAPTSASTAAQWSAPYSGDYHATLRITVTDVTTAAVVFVEFQAKHTRTGGGPPP